MMHREVHGSIASIMAHSSWARWEPRVCEVPDCPEQNLLIVGCGCNCHGSLLRAGPLVAAMPLMSKSFYVQGRHVLHLTKMLLDVRTG